MISNGYIPIPHIPWSVEVAGLPRSISVIPDGGRFLVIFILGIRTTEEQSNVPFVSNFNTVGIPAFATLVLGRNPPLARISTYCFPSTIVTLGPPASGISSGDLSTLVSRKAPPMSAMETIIDMMVDFMVCFETG